MNRAEQAALGYCSVLFADIDGERLDGYEATIWTAPDRKTRWLSELTPAAIATAIREADTRQGVESVYLSMGLARPGTPHTRENEETGGIYGGRLKNEDVGALTHLWADIDIAGPGHTSGKILAPDLASALRILDECGLAPTMVVFTGGGIHAYWKFAEPWVFAEETDPAAAAVRAAKLVRDWQLTLALIGHRLGRWAIDATADFSRVLRAAGTTNRKVAGAHRAVEVLKVDETAAYDPDDFDAHTADQKYLDQFVGMADWRDGETIKPQAIMAIWRMVNSGEYRARGYMPEWLGNAVESGTLSESDAFLKIWRKGHESGDDSSTDMSLARRIADLSDQGFDQVDAVEIIMCRRLRDGAKVEKVDPHKRLDYIQRTVGRAFAESKKKREAAAARQATLAAGGKAALAAQEAAREQARAQASTPAPQPAPPLPPTSSPDPVDMAATAPRGARGLGGAIAAELEQRTERRHPDPEPPPPAPEPEPEPPAPEPPTPSPAAPPSAGPDVVEPPAPEPGATIPEPPAPEPAAEPEPIPPTPSLRPVVAGPSIWGSRSEHHASELNRLSQTLLGKEAEQIKIWRLQQRGRGAKAERRLLMRGKPDYAFTGAPPEGYVPGYPMPSGWWPAGAFDKVGGFLKALRQDLFLPTQPVKQEEFALGFGDSLVRLWEPDTSGGSLANAVAAGMVSYLLAFPPVVSWPDAVAQGMPYIVQEAPRWEVTSPFVVLVRWIDFSRHMRTHYAINPTPPVMTDMAEMAGALPEPTQTQDGKWRRIRYEYLDVEQWRHILHAAMVVDLQREERHGMRVFDGGKAEDGQPERGQPERGQPERGQRDAR